MSKLKEKLGKEKYSQFLELIKDTDIKENEIGLLDGFVPRERLNQVSDKLKATEESLNSYKTQIEDTKNLLAQSEKFKEESETFKTKFTDLETKFNSEIESKNKEIENVSKKSLGRERLVLKGVKYPELLLDKVDWDKISYKDEKVFGLDEEMTRIEESYKDMFPTTENNPTNINTGSGEGEPGGDDEFSYLDAIE